jgi:hypothetical protein
MDLISQRARPDRDCGKRMNTLATLLVLGLLLGLTFGQPLKAQSAKPVADAKATKSDPTGQAPDDATRKIAELVHAGKYSEAQQLTAGLLIAYPGDQRLVKAKAVIEKLLSPNADPSGSPQTRNTASAQPAANGSAELLTGMEKVDYNALIALARQAKQTTDLPEQKQLLQQFMGQSSAFLQKHPDQILIWQLRAASAIGLEDPAAGYEAGQKLIAAGATESNDPNLEQLLAQLKNKGWLDKERGEKAARYEWLVGAWSCHYSSTDKRGHVISPGDESFDLSVSDSSIEGHKIKDGVRRNDSNFKVTILDSGETRCEMGWLSTVLSCDVDSASKTIKIVFQNPNKADKDNTHTWELRK